jgi:hypothetical protein
VLSLQRSREGPDIAGSRGLLRQSGAFTPINFPLATSTTAIGINDAG